MRSNAVVAVMVTRMTRGKMVAMPNHLSPAPFWFNLKSGNSSRKPSGTSRLNATFRFPAITVLQEF